MVAGRALVASLLLTGVGCAGRPLGPSSSAEPPSASSGLHASMDGLRSRPDTVALSRVGQVGFAGLSPAEVNAMTDGQRRTLAAVARCALPPDATIVYPGGAVYEGGLGLAPEIETGACETACQEIMSACLLAHVNSSALSIPLWLTSDAPAMGRVTSTSYPIEEATFFGNLWAVGAPGVYCKASSASEHPVSGRLGSATNGGEPRADADERQVGTCGACARTASGAIESCTLEGVTFAHPITAWRARTYEAESATLAGGATITGYPGRDVVLVGRMFAGASVVFGDVLASRAGANTLAVYFTNGDPLGAPARKVSISVNGGLARLETFAASGLGWGDARARLLTFDDFRAGANTVSIAVPEGAEGPSLDWIQLAADQ